MTGTEARAAMLKERIVQYEGKLYRIAAVIQRIDHRYEPERLRTLVELEDAEQSFLVREPSRPRAGYAREIPVEEITIYK